MDCKICSRPNASSYNHYGATQICGSCRGFFMRATQNGLYQTFQHAKKCVINAHNRTSCKKCRFAKCLEVGMKISYVKTLQEKSQKYELVSPVERPRSIQGFPEKAALEAAYDTHWEIVFDCLHGCYVIIPNNPCGFLEHVCRPQTYPNSEEFISTKNKFEWFVYKKMMTLLAIKDGVQEDLQILYQTNFDKMQTFRNILVFSDNYYQIDPLIDFGNARRSNSSQIDEIMKIYDNHGVDKNFKLDYDQFFSSPWAPNIMIEIEHERIFKNTLNWYNYAQSGEKTRINKCIFILIHLILLYNVDKKIEKMLKNPKEIKKLQVQYANLLHKYLVSKHKRQVANAMFGKGLMFIHDLQRAHDLYQQRLRLL